MPDLAVLIRDLEKALQAGHAQTLATRATEVLEYLKLLNEPLCKDDPDWDWWLKLPPEHRGAIVQHYRALIREIK